jgi:ribosomal protein S18 acetylase RimI-like enzyme
MRLVDWREAPAVLQEECDTWQAELGWDLSASWRDVEPARSRGQLPGFLAYDDRGRPAGWTLFLRHRDALQIGAIVAVDAATTSALVEGIVAAPEARGASMALSFTRAQAPGLADELRAHDFDTESYRYCEASTELVTGVGANIRTWAPSDMPAITELLGAAYAPSTELRPFAPDGRVEEWTDYLRQLVGTNACGAFLPDASAVVGVCPSGRLDGAVLTTTIDPRTAHIAQVAVSPVAQGQGLGGRLVSWASAMAHVAGYTRITLLVAARNQAANALYARLGFSQTALFLAAVRRQPRSSTSAGCVSDGASTLR